jgi:uridine kinase
MSVAQDINEHELVDFLAAHLSRLKKPGTVVVAIVGGPGSGKGVLSAALAKKLPSAGVLLTDSYLLGDRAYRKKLEAERRDPTEKYDFTFFKEQVRTIRHLPTGQSLRIPKYDEATGVAIGKDPRLKQNPSAYPTRFTAVTYLVIEGDFQPLPRNEVDCLIYLDVPDEVRLANRQYRDLREAREPSPEAVTASFTKRQAQFETYTLPNKEAADIIVSVRATELRKPTLHRKFNYAFSVRMGAV